MQHVHNDWVCFEIWKGIYSLPQSSILGKNSFGYYQSKCTPRQWCHKWQPIMFTLIVDDFGIEYVGKKHTIHLVAPSKKTTISQKTGKVTSTQASTLLELLQTYMMSHNGRLYQYHPHQVQSPMVRKTSPITIQGNPNFIWCKSSLHP